METHPENTSLSIYAKNPDLLGRDRMSIERHLNTCAQCRGRLEEIQTIHSSFERLRKGLTASERMPDCLSDEDVVDYVSGSLTGERQMTLKRHLEACSACAKEVELLRESLHLFEHAPVLPSPGGLAERLIRAVHAEDDLEPQRSKAKDLTSHAPQNLQKPREGLPSIFQRMFSMLRKLAIDGAVVIVLLVLYHGVPYASGVLYAKWTKTRRPDLVQQHRENHPTALQDGRDATFLERPDDVNAPERDELA